jgi:hypothetical protein
MSRLTDNTHVLTSINHCVLLQIQMFLKFHFQAVHDASPSLAFVLPDSIQQSYILFLYVNEYGVTDFKLYLQQF